MDKTRRVVVVSPRSYNERHGYGPGRCLVVPFSASHPGDRITPSDVFFARGKYSCLNADTWAVCSSSMAVSHERLDRVRVANAFPRELLSEADLNRIAEGLKHAFGIAIASAKA